LFNSSLQPVSGFMRSYLQGLRSQGHTSPNFNASDLGMQCPRQCVLKRMLGQGKLSAAAKGMVSEPDMYSMVNMRRGQLWENDVLDALFGPEAPYQLRQPKLELPDPDDADAIDFTGKADAIVDFQEEVVLCEVKCPQGTSFAKNARFKVPMKSSYLAQAMFYYVYRHNFRGVTPAMLEKPWSISVAVFSGETGLSMLAQMPEPGKDGSTQPVTYIHGSGKVEYGVLPDEAKPENIVAWVSALRRAWQPAIAQGVLPPMLPPNDKGKEPWQCSKDGECYKWCAVGRICESWSTKHMAGAK
jgi:hypothetical protein